MATRVHDKKICTGCQSKRTTARCSSCSEALCRTCRAVGSMCDGCAEFFHNRVIQPEETVRRRMSDAVLFGEPELSEPDYLFDRNPLIATA